MSGRGRSRSTTKAAKAAGRSRRGRPWPTLAGPLAAVDGLERGGARGRLPRAGRGAGLGFGKLAQPLRVALTGRHASRPGCSRSCACSAGTRCWRGSRTRRQDAIPARAARAIEHGRSAPRVCGRRSISRPSCGDRRKQHDRQATTKAATCRRRRRQAGPSFPVLEGTLGPDVIDVRKLYGQTGMFTYDPGFTSTASCSSQDHLHRRRRGRPAASRLHDRGPGQEQLVPRGRLPDPERRAAERRPRSTSSCTVSPTTPCCTSRSSSCSAASAATRTRWR